ncbi:MAG: hypothetical protein NXH75_17855 [Halobacteriovoraceae bacterium]|nr:hypothetical protein [Halobacteriovoraceae bacterium]
MNIIKLTWVTAFLALFTMASAMGQVNRNSTEYNLQGGIGLKGYDPVSYFAEGGDTPAKGSSSISLSYKGVTYLFASQSNKATFQSFPEKYEPTYGGWCAWAMAAGRGQKVDIDPLLFTIHGNRAHFFIAPSAKRNFDRNVSRFESRADQNWKRISGEEPRI